MTLHSELHQHRRHRARAALPLYFEQGRCLTMRLPGFQPSRSSAIRTRQAYVVGGARGLKCLHVSAGEASTRFDRSISSDNGSVQGEHRACHRLFGRHGAKGRDESRGDEWASPENPPVRACVGGAGVPGGDHSDDGRRLRLEPLSAWLIRLHREPRASPGRNYRR